MNPTEIREGTKEKVMKSKGFTQQSILTDTSGSPHGRKSILGGRGERLEEVGASALPRLLSLSHLQPLIISTISLIRDHQRSVG